MRSIFVLLGAISSALAHGYVQEVTANGVKHSGYLPYSDPYYNPIPDRIIRPIPGNGPVEDVNLIDMQCNGYSAGGVVGSKPAPIFATVAAGSSVTLNWTAWPDSHLGPIITYMAYAPSDITKWNPGSSKVFFKVAEAGYSNGVWAATKLINNNGIYTFTVPKSLKAGQYLVRHEIIALHGAWQYPGAQFYPSCIQLQVTGSGTSTGPSSGLVAFPGAYTASTPGVVFDVYQGNPSSYPIPGPAVWSG
ncbi:glycoside hydrolase [Auricularia subglabra TFB-10046 SS5]|nr:glycoside hydrolase [Auricularia subglabra TFB-10046 SS5]